MALWEMMLGLNDWWGGGSAGWPSSGDSDMGSGVWVFSEVLEIHGAYRVSREVWPFGGEVPSCSRGVWSFTL